MKHCKKLTLLLIAALLLAAALMTGCTGRTPAQDAPADTKKEGIYVRLERDDAYAVYLNGDSFTKVCENADGTPLKSGEWIFAGEDIAKLSQEENRSVLFTVGASGSDDTLLEEASFFYDIAKGTLYVTVGAEGVTCSTSGEPDAMADVPPVLKLAILDEIDETVTVGVSGSSLRAVQAAVQLIDWGVNTGLGADEIGEAASTWLAAKNDGLTEYLQKLEMVDDAYQRLLTDEARDMLDSAGCAGVEITWGSQPIEPIEAIMQAAGLR